MNFDLGHAAAVHLNDSEAITAEVETFAATRDEAELGENESANGGIGRVVRKLDIVLGSQIANIEGSVKDDGAIGEGLGVLDDVKLIVDLTHHLLDDVFDSNQAEDTAEFVHDHGQADAARAKLE